MKNTVLRHERFQDARSYYNQHGDETMAEVAIGSGVSKSTIGRMEKDDNTSLGCNDVVKLAKYYNVSTDFLLGLDPSPYRHKNHLSADCQESGLSYRALENVMKSHNELIPQAFSILEYILASPGLSEFLSSLAYSIERLHEYEAYAAEVSSSPNSKIKLEDKYIEREEFLTFLQRSLENERFRMEYGWIEYLKGLCDIDAIRSAVHDSILKESKS